MKRLIFSSLLLLPYSISADEEEYGSYRELNINREDSDSLTEDEKLFLEADESFDPWYAGPAVIGGSSNIAPGVLSITPLALTLTQNYGILDEHRNASSIKNRFVLSAETSILVGLTSWLDFTLVLEGFGNFEGKKSSGGFGDLIAGIGIPILEEGLYQPAIRFVFNETFPTGRYQKLVPNLDGLDGTGLGTFGNEFGLRASKIIFWKSNHPVNLRAAYSYNLFTHVHVKGFNSYGGGYGAHGTVKPGSSQQVNVAGELSLSDNWVFVLDMTYDWTNRVKFRGNHGVLDKATPVTPNSNTPDNGQDLPYTIRFESTSSAVGSGSSDQLSLTPAIQYMPDDHLTLIGSIWFNVYGRNVPQFVAYGLSLNYTF